MKKSNSNKLLQFLETYWYLIAFVVVFGGYLWKKKKVDPVNKDQNANDVLTGGGIKDQSAQNRYKSYALQLAENLGTAYAKYDPRHWIENDEEVYNLMVGMSTADFEMIKRLYFSTYAKGRDLSTDLANLLDDKFYKILRVK